MSQYRLSVRPVNCARQLCRALVGLLAIAVTCVIPNPANLLAAAQPASVAVETSESASDCAHAECAPDHSGFESSEDLESSKDLESSEEEEEDDRGPLPEVSDDVVEEDELITRCAAGDLAHLSAIGSARPGFSSRLPRPLGRA